LEDFLKGGGNKPCGKGGTSINKKDALEGGGGKEGNRKGVSFGKRGWGGGIHTMIDRGEEKKGGTGAVLTNFRGGWGKGGATSGGEDKPKKTGTTKRGEGTQCGKEIKTTGSDKQGKTR